jgi:hypothetical protein
MVFVVLLQANADIASRTTLRTFLPHPPPPPLILPLSATGLHPESPTPDSMELTVHLEKPPLPQPLTKFPTLY